MEKLIFRESITQWKVARIKNLTDVIYMRFDVVGNFREMKRAESYFEFHTDTYNEKILLCVNAQTLC